MGRMVAVPELGAFEPGEGRGEVVRFADHLGTDTVLESSADGSTVRVNGVHLTQEQARAVAAMLYRFGSSGVLVARRGTSGG